MMDLLIEINGVEFDFEVEYDLDLGQKEIIHRAPEDCQEGIEPSIDPINLVMIIDNQRYNVSFMLENEEFYQSVVSDIWSNIDDESV